MITYSEALQTILSQVHPLLPESLPLDQITGYVTAEPLVSRFDLPPFNNSAVDGYGVHVEDIHAASLSNLISLDVIKTIKAGGSTSTTLPPGAAVRLFTGAQVMDGVDAVVMQERVVCHGNKAVFASPAGPGENIRYQGKELLKGTRVLDAGKVITPPIVGLLATFGYNAFPVYPKPRIGLVVTGSELLAPGEPLQSGHIYDSNSYALCSALQLAGFPPPLVKRVPDDPKVLQTTLADLLGQIDVLLITGGVSVGEHDYVKNCLSQLNVQTVIWKVAIKPGKPFYFGTHQRNAEQSPQLVFGLPGNPVSVLMTWYQLVAPALNAIQGLKIEEPEHVYASLTLDIWKEPGRLEWVRARTVMGMDGEMETTPAFEQNSQMLSGLAKANSIIIFPQDSTYIPAGKQVPVQFLNWKGARE